MEEVISQQSVSYPAHVYMSSQQQDLYALVKTFKK